MRGERHAAIASVGADGGPQAAVVGVVVSHDFEIFFDTLASTRKAANLRARGRAAVVVGGFEAAAARTVQLEGLADEPRGTDLERLKQLYFDRFVDGPTRQASTGLIYMRVRPSWLRYSDFRAEPPSVVELDALGLDRLT